jgi:hypothetical protein
MLFNRVSQVPHPQALARLIEIAVCALLEVGLGEVLLELVPKGGVGRVAGRGEEVSVLVVRRSMSLVSSALPGAAPALRLGTIGFSQAATLSGHSRLSRAVCEPGSSTKNTSPSMGKLTRTLAPG